MKKPIIFLLAFASFICALHLSANSSTKTMVVEEESAWITPTGVTIPAEFMNSWQDHIASLGKKYTTRFCPSVNGVIQLKCIVGKPDDCTKVFDCLPCINCN